MDFQQSCSTARLVDGIREPGPSTEWLLVSLGWTFEV